MGNCANIQNVNAGEMIYSCCPADSNIESTEVKCGREFIEYYLENKIEKFFINSKKMILVDKSDKAYSVEIEPSKIYFEIMRKNCKCKKKIYFFQF